MKKSIHQKAANNNCQAGAVKEEFTGKNLTRFGGSGLIRRFLKRHKIKELFESRVKIDGRKARKYPTGTIFVSCLYGIFLGYTRPHHMKVLCADRVFQRLVGLVGFPVQSSISRFLSCMRVAVSRQIASLNFDLLMKFRRGFKEFEAITLDLDSHVMPVYGKQQRAGLGYNPKKRGRKIIRAGGLTPVNVAEAVAAGRPWAVDTASGVEVKKGIKDITKMRRFIQNAKAA